MKALDTTTHFIDYSMKRNRSLLSYLAPPNAVMHVHGPDVTLGRDRDGLVVAIHLGPALAGRTLRAHLTPHLHVVVVVQAPDAVGTHGDELERGGLDLGPILAHAAVRLAGCAASKPKGVILGDAPDAGPAHPNLPHRPLAQSPPRSLARLALCRAQKLRGLEYHHNWV